MKPTAATVLPAPVACSNQKRRSAPGSSGASSIVSSSSSAGASSQSCGSSSGASSSSSRASSPSSSPAAAGRLLGHLDHAVAVGLVGDRDLLLGHQLGQRARESVNLVRVQFRPVAQFRRFVGQQSLQTEQQREVPPPLDRRVLRPCVQLFQGSVQRTAARRARSERLGPLAVEQEGLADELSRPLYVGTRWNCRPRGNFAGLGHEGFRIPSPPQLTMGGGTRTRMPGVCIPLPPALSAACIADANRTYVL